MRPSTERRRRAPRARLGTLAAALLLAGAPGRADAQGTSFFERLGLDKLQLTAVGASTGPVHPAKTAATQAYSVHADYGEVARNLHVVFVVSYWGSHFRPDVVDKFAAQIRNTVIDPSGDDTLRIGNVSVSDISLETDLRYSPRSHSLVRPYIGGSIGAHVINAENRFIAGTFVESALDAITTGVTGIAGADIVPFRGVAVGLQGRYTLISTVRFATIRVTATYAFHLAKPSRSP